MTTVAFKPTLYNTIWCRLEVHLERRRHVLVCVSAYPILITESTQITHALNIRAFLSFSVVLFWENVQFSDKDATAEHFLRLRYRRLF